MHAKMAVFTFARRTRRMAFKIAVKTILRPLLEISNDSAFDEYNPAMVRVCLGLGLGLGFCLGLGLGLDFGLGLGLGLGLGARFIFSERAVVRFESERWNYFCDLIFFLLLLSY